MCRELKQITKLIINVLLKTSNVLFASTFALMFLLPLHAIGIEEKSGIIYEGENNVISGKEHLFIGSVSKKNDTIQVQNLQPEISSNDFSYIFIAKNAQICGKEHLYAKQDTRLLAKKSSKTKTKTDDPVKNDITEKESREEIIVPDFPVDPASVSHSYSSKESAIPVSQQKFNAYPAVCKVTRENAYPGFENSSLSLYLPQQRQKLSVAATQCGILTSFAPNSPSL